MLSRNGALAGGEPAGPESGDHGPSSPDTGVRGSAPSALGAPGELDVELERDLLDLARMVGRLRGGVVGPIGIELERSGYLILRLLADEGPVRIGRLSQVFDLDPSTVTRQVQTVVRRGLVEKSVDPDDRRAALLAITERGRAAVAGAQEHRHRWLAGVLGEWSDDERASFARMLARFNHDARRSGPSSSSIEWSDETSPATRSQRST